MRLVLFRHGHKQFSMDNDPSLSDRGYIQATHLLDLVEKKQLPLPTQCWFSEKKRTFETLSALDQIPNIQWLKKSHLNERTPKEDTSQFQSRISSALKEFTKSATPNEVLFICTHYDWIEDAMSLIPCDKNLTSFEFINWAPGQYIEFDYYDDLFHVVKKGLL
jgi:broad specificity phosphatase PhoE